MTSLGPTRRCKRCLIRLAPYINHQNKLTYYHFASESLWSCNNDEIPATTDRCDNEGKIVSAKHLAETSYESVD